MGVIKVITILLLFAVGLVSGVYIAIKKFTDDSINNFCETQHLRDENRRLRELLDRRPNYEQIAYICDRTMCENCNSDCRHCFDIAHAKNFECVAENEYWEKGSKRGNTYQKFADEVTDMLMLFCDDDDQITLKKCELEVNMKSILEEFK